MTIVGLRCGPRHVLECVVAVVALLLMTATFAADERGALGFGIEVDGSGFFLNPTIESVTVTSIATPSPAASAGIAIKDRIIEADGHPVVGAKARDLEPLLKKKVGEIIRLRLRRPNGDEYAVTLVAVARAGGS